MQLNKNDIARFWKKVNKKNDDECWTWIGGQFSRGYGTFWLNNISRVASRVSYTIHFGKIPDGLIVCHVCDNPNCVNPNHLWLGTHRDNAIDRNSKKRDNHSFILPISKQAEIAHLWYTQDFIQRELAEKYNISRSLVNKIIRMKHFKDRYKQKKIKRIWWKINDSKKLDIVNRIKFGETQLSLSKEYEISPRSIRLYVKQLSNP